jgi:hypothetical protein
METLRAFFLILFLMWMAIAQSSRADALGNALESPDQQNISVQLKIFKNNMIYNQWAEDALNVVSRYHAVMALKNSNQISAADLLIEEQNSYLEFKRLVIIAEEYEADVLADFAKQFNVLVSDLSLVPNYLDHLSSEIRRIDPATLSPIESLWLCYRMIARIENLSVKSTKSILELSPSDQIMVQILLYEVYKNWSAVGLVLTKQTHVPELFGSQTTQ